MDVSLTDGYPYLQVQLTGKLQKGLAEFIVSDTGKK